MKIIRSNRRTLALIIETDGSLTVRAPHRLSQQEIDQFLAEKQAWIQEKQQLAAKHALPAHQFDSSDRFAYLGTEYGLRLVDNPTHPLSLIDGSFLLDRRKTGRAREIFTSWYRAQARSVFTERLSFQTNKHAFKYAKLRISSARTRWGSCSSLKTITLTWRLVMAPLPIVDYVIIHELAHLEFPNHSRQFWERVEQLCPEYRLHRRWLKDNGARLTL